MPYPPSNSVPGLSNLRFTPEQKSAILAIFEGNPFPSKVDLKKCPERESTEVLENVLGRVGLWPLPASGVVEGVKFWKRTNVDTTPRAKQNGKKRARSRMICFQCRCGVDNSQRKDYTANRRRVSKSKYTGCLAHCRISVKISENGEKDVEGPIRWFQGYFEHNDGCVDSAPNRNMEIKLDISDTYHNENIADPDKIKAETSAQPEASLAISEAVIEKTIQTGTQRLRDAVGFALAEYNELNRFVQAYPEKTEGTQLAKIIQRCKETMEQLQILCTQEGLAQPLPASTHIIQSPSKNVRTAITAGLLPFEHVPKQRKYALNAAD